MLSSLAQSTGRCRFSRLTLSRSSHKAIFESHPITMNERQAPGYVQAALNDRVWV